MKLTIVSTVKEAVLRAVIEQHTPPPLGMVAVLGAIALGVDSTGVVDAMLKLHHDALAKGGPFAGEGVKERARRGGGGVTRLRRIRTEKILDMTAILGRWQFFSLGICESVNVLTVQFSIPFSIFLRIGSTNRGMAHFFCM